MTNKILYDYAMSFIGKPYIWGGDDPILGYDCSGFVQEILEAAGVDPKGDQTAQGLYNHFYKVDYGRYQVREFGSLAFYGKDFKRITHIAFCLDTETIIEAGGGGTRTNNAEDAARQNAYIRVRPLRRRSDLIVCIKPRYSWDKI